MGSTKRKPHAFAWNLHIASAMGVVGVALVVAAISVDVAVGAEEAKKPLGDVFDAIYANGAWGRNAEGRGTSGFGSTLAFTRDYRAYLESFIKTNKIRSVVDAGCGDWEFSSAVDWNHARYLGVDISSRAIATAKERYAGKTVRFKVGDVTDSLPAADLLICKDVLQHLPNALVQRFIKNNLKKGKYKWAIITNDRGSTNVDIKAGEHRPIDLGAPPFNVKGLVDLPIDYRDPYHKTSQLLDLR